MELKTCVIISLWHRHNQQPAGLTYSSFTIVIVKELVGAAVN